MKKFAGLIIGWLIFSSAFAVMPKDSANFYMQQANKRYENSEYQAALDIYKKIEADYRSPVLFYNMGNCYFKLGDIPSAILYYERSLKYDPENENTLANLEQARKLITDNIQAVPETALSQWWKNFSMNRSINFWAHLSIYLMFAGFLVLILAVVRTPYFIKRFSAFLGVLLILSAIVTFFLARSVKNAIENDNYAVVFTSKVDVMSEPRDNGSRLFVIHDGLKVEIVGENTDWYEIKLANGAIGWIKKEDVRVI